jgi:hypothetical protein
MRTLFFVIFPVKGVKGRAFSFFGEAATTFSLTVPGCSLPFADSVSAANDGKLVDSADARVRTNVLCMAIS